MTSGFSDPTQAWFDATFAAPTAVQRRGWAAIDAGSNALLVAPTGSGKTLAAFLAGIDACLNLDGDAPPGVRVLYVSPLKALVYDVERNLRSPLVGIRHHAERLGLPVRAVTTAVRTGDTSQRDRRQQAKAPADILVTTPESLYLLLGSKARETLRHVHTVIVDEIHALAPTKRGVHLALSLERLAALADREPQRVGLSATVRPLDEVAGFLGGRQSVEVIDESAPPLLDLEVTMPEAAPSPDAGAPRGGSILGELYRQPQAQPGGERGIWPAIYPRLLAEIDSNRATIIFVNSRGLCERLTQRLNELAGQEVVQSHHGSVSHARRAEIEEGLKLGHVRGIVATSSLELGIDMGAIDRVIQIESPGSVARGLQRVGRAGHQVGETSAGRLFAKFRGDLVECAVIAQQMQVGEIEPIRVPRNALDVLAQQVVAMCCDAPRDVASIAACVRGAFPYRQLTDEALNAVLEMLAGQFPAHDLAEWKPLLAWDRATDTLRPRRGAAMVARMNAGTIPDRGNYVVTLGPDGGRLGELDEEMVFETRPGENILLGASTWRVEEITRDRVIVSPAAGEPGKLPFWRGDGPGRPIELGRALGGMVAKLAAMPRQRALRFLQRDAALDAATAATLIDYLDEQKQHSGVLPSDKQVVIERFRDELGDWRVCILSPFGARVHAPWAMALQHELAQRSGFDVQVMYTDDGIVLRFADMDDLPGLDVLLPDPDELDDKVTEQLAHTAMFAGLFRENAARALLLPRRRPDQRTPLWAQRLKAQNLLAGVRQYPGFPIVLETYRQALGDIFDIAALREVLRAVRSRRVLVHDVETPSASPFARSLVFAYVAAYIYEQDSPLAERKAQALTLDRNLLSELLGREELRELIDAEVLERLELELQHLVDDRVARDADEVHDLLRRLGDLSADEIAARAATDVAAALARLVDERRAIRIRLAGDDRWIAAEYAGLYRDGLGAMPPAGLPDSFLQAVDDPLEQLCRRYARTHGPFQSAQLAARFALRVAHIEPALKALRADGTLVQGEIRPGGTALDWCDADVLRRLKRRTLARLRDAASPVDDASLGLFLPQWHELGCERDGTARLLEVVQQLQGLPIAWSALQATVLPARIAGFRLDMLDMLAATGQVVWVGRGPLGARDGRVALYLREQVRDLLRPSDAAPDDSPIAGAILEHLAARGASFLFELEDAVRAALGEVSSDEFRAVLWNLVWSGHVSNDTFAPLRSLSQPARRRSRRWQAGNDLAGGRWSRVDALTDPAVEDTRRALAWANVLLDRYGVVSREMAAAEELPGGFGPVYKVLSALEESGRVRRGYFIEGLSGAQFARPGVVDRLRGVAADWRADEADADIEYLPAIDPANPWGSLLPWPDSGAAAAGVRPRRVAGAWLLVYRGRPVIYVAPNGRSLLTFAAGLADPDVRAAAFAALHHVPKGHRRGALLIEKIDAVAVRESAYLDELLHSGFVSDYRGLTSSASTV
ncbi:MAG: DEAD/DEAH box helicase [Gammaproteobacteria bacterium]|nr:DEAD/DEAH box helicase [Gammaproteobacteria bacterium]